MLHLYLKMEEGVEGVGGEEALWTGIGAGGEGKRRGLATKCRQQLSLAWAVWSRVWGRGEGRAGQGRSGSVELCPTPSPREQKTAQHQDFPTQPHVPQHSVGAYFPSSSSPSQ